MPPKKKAAAVPIDPSDLLDRTEQLLRQYDILRYQEDNFDKLLEIENELKQIRNQSNALSVDTEFDLYPRLGDDNFGQRLARKKEFYKSKYREYRDITPEQYEKHANGICNSAQSVFRLSPNQILLKNFLNPKTPYNSILLYHGVGVGKCHGRGTKILMWSGDVKEVQNIQCGEYLMGDDGEAREVLSLAQGRDMLYKVTGGGVEWTGNSEHILCLKYFGQNIYYEAETLLWLMESINPVTLEYMVVAAETQREIEYIRDIQQQHQVYEIPIKMFIKMPVTVREDFKAFRVILEGCKEGHALTLKCSPLKEPLDTRIAWLNEYLAIHCQVLSDGQWYIDDVIDETLVMCLRSAGYNVLEDRHGTTISKARELTYDITVEPCGENEYFGFVITGNHRYLLRDLTVTHNTCTAVTIAENFHSQFKNKTLVLLPTSIKDNFRRQIFDVSKLSSTLDPGDSQCVAQKYLNLIPDKKGLNKELLDKRVNKLINESYDFMGFMEFGNLVKGIADAAKKRHKGNPEAAEAALRLKLREMFSDRVIIVDEVHNARTEKAVTKKRVPPLLLKMLESAQNVKLVLCTATPMFNSADEIVQLLNYMMANEKRPQLEKSDLFENGELKDPALLARTCRGLVSYMRGDNPFTFPLRLYPSFNKDGQRIKKPPSIDINGKDIPVGKRLKTKEVVLSVMSDFQGERYREVKEQQSDEFESELNDDDIDDVDIESDEKKAHLSLPIQISNIVFPSGNHGKVGFQDCFNEVDGSGKGVKFEYKKSYKDILSFNNIGEYSAKLRSIAEYILNSKGIVFVYSYYIWSALIPLAITLEHMGLKINGRENLLANGVKEGMMTGTYSLLVRDPKFAVDLAKEVQDITNPQNIDGNKVKVILASSVVAEGIDFKRIREVHIVEPWYHQNKAEQIIGRAVRTCSHTSLPLHERNVTIYQHAAVLDRNTEQESIDLQIYRIAEQKQEAINQVANVMRDNSIDCQLNKGVSYFDPDVLNFRTRVDSSQGTKALSYRWGDRNTTYQTTCTHLNNSGSGANDDSTFTTDMYLDDVGYYADFVMNLYRKPDMSFDYTRTFTYEEIHDGVKLLMSNMDEDILKYTLNVLLNSGKSKEYLAFIGKKYIIMPATANFGYVTMKERHDYKPLLLERLVAKDEEAQVVSSEEETGDKQPNASPVAESNINILEVINERIVECRNKLATQYHQQFQTVIIDYVIDRLSADELNALFLHDAIPSNIKASLQRAGAMVELEVGKVGYRSSFKSDSWVWKVDGKLVKVPPVELSKHSRKIHNLLEKHIAKPHECFLDYHKTHGFQFKLLTNNKHSKGCVCSRTASNTREILIELIERRGFGYKGLLVKEDDNKEDLCFLLELSTRAVNDGDLLKRPLHYKDFIESSQKSKEVPNNSVAAPKKRGRKPKAVASNS